MNVSSAQSVAADPLSPQTLRTALRRAFGTFTTGVTVVTVGAPVPHAMTANSFTTVSLEPALALVCVGRDAVMHPALAESGRFGVSVLADWQEGVARHFADNNRPLGIRQFDAVDWTPGPTTGVPLIRGALAHFELELWRSYDGGDHSIFVGELVAFTHQSGDPLIFHRGRFGQPVSARGADR